MTMMFRFDSAVDLTRIEAGTKMHMQLTKDEEGRAIITDVHIMDSMKIKAKQPEQNAEPPMDHHNHHQHH